MIQWMFLEKDWKSSLFKMYEMFAFSNNFFLLFIHLFTFKYENYFLHFSKWDSNWMHSCFFFWKIEKCLFFRLFYLFQELHSIFSLLLFFWSQNHYRFPILLFYRRSHASLCFTLYFFWEIKFWNLFKLIFSSDLVFISNATDIFID